jgi:hypothetical protein
MIANATPHNRMHLTGYSELHPLPAAGDASRQPYLNGRLT